MATTIGSLDLNAFSDLYSDSTQYFWFESNASATYGAGAHVTLVPDTSFISNPTGQNILMNTEGFSIRNGLLPMMTLDNDSLDFNVVDTTAGTYTTTATFTATGAQIGQSGAAHSVMDADGQRFYASDGTTQLANIGYGTGTSQSGTATAPYYTFGVRKTTTTAYSSSSTYAVGDICVYDEKVYVCVYAITTPESWNTSHWKYYIGNYSVAEGYNTIASGFASHAEGFYTTASGREAHAEGYQTTASGYQSHAEGWRTTASSDFSHAEGLSTTASAWDAHAEGEKTTASYSSAHAEGYYTIASGWISHSGGEGTIAQRKSQYTIGAYNIADNGGYSEAYRGNYVFIIGNGTSDTARSNALTVDWNGNVDLPTGKFSGVGETLTYDASNSGTNALEINNASSNAFTVDWDGNAEAAGDYYSKVNQISLGTYITGGVLTSGSSNIHFSIPTGRVFPNGTTISKLTFNIVVRASNSNASGLYIVKDASGGTDVKYYDSTASFQFYNGANQPKTLTTAMSTISLQGGTNIYVNWVGSGNYFFSGTSTYNGYVNNQPISVMLTDITATLNIPS